MNVTELWRFPIKSMLGEQLSEVQVGPLGFEGDMRRAVIDVDSGVSLSAKRYAELLRCRCRTVGDTVSIEFADGDNLDADSSRAAELLEPILLLISRPGNAIGREGIAHGLSLPRLRMYDRI